MVAINQQQQNNHQNGGGRRSAARFNCSTTKIFIGLLILATALLWTSIMLAVRLTVDENNNNNNNQQQQYNQLILKQQQSEEMVVQEKEFVRSPSRKQQQPLQHNAQIQSPAVNNHAGGDENLLLTNWIIQQRGGGSNNNDGSSNTDSSSPSSSSSQLSNLLSTPLNFTPGTLPLSQLSTLQHCHVDAQYYQHHLKSGIGQLSYSKKYNLSYILLPKSGSSTGRYMMKTHFDAIEPRGGQNNKAVMEAMTAENIIAFVREPLSRFYSQYDEAYVRTAPWSKSQNPYYIDPNTPQQTTTNKNKVHPFPFLYENLHSYQDYEDVFCPPSTRKNPTNRRECLFRQSQEDGTLAQRLDRFVQEYNGRNPYDVHLMLQVPKLVSITTNNNNNNNGGGGGRSKIRITELYNTTNAEYDWQLIAKKYIGQDADFTKGKKNGGGKSGGSGVIEGRSYPRRFDKSLVRRETEWRICRLALLDYCCLNFPLPSSCMEEARVMGLLSCMMDYDDERGMVRVQPGVFPDVA